jgi:ribosome-binding factor A
LKKRSSPGHRSRRAAEAVRETVTAFLSEEARDPRIGMVTVTNVRVTGDLQRAVVSFVVHGDEKARQDTLVGLTHAASAVRRRLGERLQLRLVPEVVFELDRGLEHAARIDALLADLHRPGEPAP